MEKKENIRKELAKIAPGLSKLEISKDFPVPENYFYSLSDHIQEKIKKQEGYKTSVLLNLLHSRLLQYSISILIILAAGYGIFNYGKNLYKNRALKNTVLTEDYILENFDSDEMIEYVSDDVNGHKNDKNGNSGNKRQLKEEAENNLLENIDESIIIEEL